MKNVRIKFIGFFLLFGFCFLFAYNKIFKGVIQLIPENRESFFESESLIGWKNVLSTILYPIKMVLVGPLLPLIDMPDLPPPFMVIALVVYWGLLALILHYIIGKLKRAICSRKKTRADMKENSE